jgi:hypothetical protein
MLPNLPSGISQSVFAQGSTLCPAQYPPCTAFPGGNWFVATKGGSGAIHYDTGGNLLIAAGNGQSALVNDEESGQAVGTIEKVTPGGSTIPFLNIGTLPSSCVQTSATTLTEFSPYVIQPFSFNPQLTTLFIVTVNRAVFVTWNPSTTTGSCSGSSFTINGPYTFSADAFTYATLALIGSNL